MLVYNGQHVVRSKKLQHPSTSSADTDDDGVRGGDSGSRGEEPVVELVVFNIRPKSFVFYLPLPKTSSDSSSTVTFED